MGGSESKSELNPNGYSKSTHVNEVVKDANLNGKNIVITGATSGIGFEMARVLASRGANVTLTYRDRARGEKALQEVQAVSPNPENIRISELDLSSFASIREFSARFHEENRPIHVLVNNAGVFAADGKTKEGFEIQFGVNHLGHFMLTNLLLDRLREGAPSRVINVTSELHKMGPVQFDDLNLEKEQKSPEFKYAQSKTANILFSNELNRRYSSQGIYSNAVTPGYVPETEIARNYSGFNSLINSVAGFLIGKPLSSGVATPVYMAISPNLERIGGKYFEDFVAKPPSPHANNVEFERRLWEVSEKLCGLD
eukprot:TRINITY_DN697_c0_g1_i1.p1 TRINITY_DN697_c0_g1~~TRINITY_DN697_c0_g1_i1.p1  ORF type:complete len:312 (+),score=67.07 TRINITY_DN697_c0_g1_i1:155-1090(+)